MSHVVVRRVGRPPPPIPATAASPLSVATGRPDRDPFTENVVPLLYQAGDSDNQPYEGQARLAGTRTYTQDSGQVQIVLTWDLSG